MNWQYTSPTKSNNGVTRLAMFQGNDVSYVEPNFLSIIYEKMNEIKVLDKVCYINGNTSDPYFFVTECKLC